MNKITDERFSAERTDFYDLTFEIRFTRLIFMVKSGSHLLWLEDHFLANASDISSCVQAARSLIAAHPFLAGRYWKSVKLISEFQIHTLLPHSHFDPSRSQQYLALTFPSADLHQMEIITEEIHGQVLVAGTVRSVNETFRSFYPDMTVTSSVAIGMKHFNTLMDTPGMGVISENFLDIYYRNKSKRIVAVKLPLRNLEEVNTLIDDLLLFGEITPYGRPYQLLKPLLKRLTLGNINETDLLPGTPAGLPSQRYFTLLVS